MVNKDWNTLIRSAILIWCGKNEVFWNFTTIMWFQKENLPILAVSIQETVLPSTIPQTKFYPLNEFFLIYFNLSIPGETFDQPL